MTTTVGNDGRAKTTVELFKSELQQIVEGVAAHI